VGRIGYRQPPDYPIVAVDYPIQGIPLEGKLYSDAVQVVGYDLEGIIPLS